MRQLFVVALMLLLTAWTHGVGVQSGTLLTDTSTQLLTDTSTQLLVTP